jgi:hypothetical protein
MKAFANLPAVLVLEVRDALVECVTFAEFVKLRCVRREWRDWGDEMFLSWVLRQDVGRPLVGFRGTLAERRFLVEQAEV